jgi:hypothetical protein
VNFFLMTFCVENRYFTSAPKHNGTKWIVYIWSS